MSSPKRFFDTLSRKRATKLHERREYGPLGAGLHEQAPNHLKLRWLRATVVNGDGKKGIAKIMSGEVQGNNELKGLGKKSAT